MFVNVYRVNCNYPLSIHTGKRREGGEGVRRGKEMREEREAVGEGRRWGGKEVRKGRRGGEGRGG